MGNKESNKWADSAAFVVSVISIFISAGGLIYQWQQSTRYSNNTHQILVNSAKLGTYDVNLMNYKVSSMPVGSLDYGQLDLQLDSLKQNLDTIKSIDPTTLPKSDAINYQVYRQDLNTVIIMMESYVSDMRFDKSKPVDKAETLHLDMGTRTNFRSGSDIAKKVLKRDETALQKNENLYDESYKKAIKEMGFDE
ncbi:hypothetical protein SOP56_02515 [Weissella confusa]|uniref:hypothetical protein n=1 Tax=Weissella confusa TaxID=1583 RepID=UPI002A75287C|nr:hypothetical protein [Weissella confusa]MDY2528730.1 hypothetical protein [Weissella confusa]